MRVSLIRCGIQNSIQRFGLPTSLLVLFLLFSFSTSNGQGPQNIRYEKAEQLRRAGKPDSALIIFNQLVSESPSEALYLYGRGGTYVALNRVNEAETDLRKSLALDPTCGRCFVWLSQMAYEKGQIDRATKLADSGVIAAPKDAKVLQYRGILRTNLGKSGALDDFNRSIELDGTLAESYLGRAQYNLANNAPLAAKMDIRKALDLDSNSAAAHYMLGMTAAASGQYEEAIDYLKRAVALGHPSPETYYTIGAVQQQLNRPEEAVMSYQTYLRQQPNDPRGWANLAGAYYMLEDMDRSCEAIASGLKVIGSDTVARGFLIAEQERFCNPETIDFYVQRGIASYNLENYHGAVDWYEKGLKKFPESMMLIWTRGNARLAMEDWKGAAADYQKVIGSKEKFYREQDEIVRRKSQQLTAADLASARGETIAAIYHDLALAFWSQDEEKKAIETIEKGLDATPALTAGYSRLLTTRGRMYAEKDELKDAVKDFRKALENNPEDVEAEFMLATTYVMQATEQEFGGSKKIETLSISAGMSGGSRVSIPISTKVTEVEVDDDDDRAKLREALGMYDRLIARVPGFSSAYRQRGFVRMLLEIDGYCEDFRKARELGDPIATSEPLPDGC